MEVGDKVVLIDGWLNFLDPSIYPPYGTTATVIRHNVSPDEVDNSYAKISGRGALIEVKWEDTQNLTVLFEDQVQSANAALPESRFHVGESVAFIAEKLHKEHPDFYPPVGTSGTVIAITGKGELCVRWKHGSTSGTDVWMVMEDNIEKRADSWIKRFLGLLFT